MSDMLDRAAMALCASIAGESRWERLTDRGRNSYRKHARAVLMAVRDNAPTRAMAESQACGDEGPFLPLLDLLDFSGENARDMVLRSAWCAAIDAILNEPSE